MLQRSWIESANDPAGDFPLNNLPYGVFDEGLGPRCGVAIGDQILDVRAVEHGLDPALFAEPAWNAFMAAGPQTWRRLRERLGALLSDPSHRDAVRPKLVNQSGVRLLMPFRVAEYTDFYSGKHHAFNVGSMFRGPENALPPNWLSMPIGYNGRASSVVVSETPVRRPWGQIKKGAPEALSEFAPSARFDFELEMGAVVGQPSEGRIGVAEAEAMIFGYVLLNDWSARDIQAWEYQPLGPFQSKATATSISPWIVTTAALAPFRLPPPARERPLLPYLAEPESGLYDIDLEVALAPKGCEETVISRTNYREMYYSSAQQLAHHATSGCPMRVGDLLGSGTISGPTRESRGSLLELSWGGKEPIDLPGGRQRRFLADGDLVTFRGAAQGEGYRVGFGSCAGRLTPATAAP